MEDKISKTILKIINESSEPLETKEVGEKVRKIVKELTRAKLFWRLNNLRGKGVIKGKFIGPGKGVWIWWRSDLDGSFKFLLNKPNSIPKLIIKNKKFFFEFLSSYFDAEGCISISVDNRGNRNSQWIIKSRDKMILDKLAEILNKLGFKLHNRMIRKTKRYNKNYWYIGTGITAHVSELLKRMKLRHGEKILKHRLLNELQRRNWKNAKNKIILLRNKIKNDVKKCMEKAKIEYELRH